MSRPWKSIKVRNRITDLIRRPGGITRSQAIKAARTDVERLREDMVKRVPDEIAGLEAIAGEAKGDYISAADLERMFAGAERLLVLAGTFGLATLDAVVKKFCDLAAGMIENGITSVAPVAVHLRAMRLVCPGAPALSERETAALLSQLARVHAHLGLSAHAPPEDDDPVTAEA